jgi:hypothetical protein
VQNVSPVRISVGLLADRERHTKVSCFSRLSDILFCSAVLIQIVVELNGTIQRYLGRALNLGQDDMV